MNPHLSVNAIVNFVIHEGKIVKAKIVAVLHRTSARLEFENGIAIAEHSPVEPGLPAVAGTFHFPPEEPPQVVAKTSPKPAPVTASTAAAKPPEAKKD